MNGSKVQNVLCIRIDGENVGQEQQQQRFDAGGNEFPNLFENEDVSPEQQRFDAAVDAVLEEIGTMLKEKNRAYGNSALNPVRVFSKADPVEQIKVRLDDKLSRLQRGSAAGEDVEKDLLGYLVLLRIARR